MPELSIKNQGSHALLEEAGDWECRGLELLVASDNSFKFCTELMRKIGEEFGYLGLVVVVYIKRIKSTDIHFSQRNSNVILRGKGWRLFILLFKFPTEGMCSW